MRYSSMVFFAFILMAICSGVQAQVNLTAGAAEYSIPLYKYADPNNRLGTGISLEYISGNGLKVNEIPSAVGAGWNLECGGVIERIQHGLPDDQKRYTEIPYVDGNFLFVYPSANYINNYYSNGYLYSEYNPAISVNNGGGYTPLFDYFAMKYAQKPEYTADLEQDVFAFSFNGRSGLFVIGKPDVNGNMEVRTLVDSKLKIQLIHGDLNNANNIRTTISEFQITDETGLRYIFKDAELIQECVYDTGSYYSQSTGAALSAPWTFYPQGSVPPQNRPIRATRATTRNAFVKSKWYLSEIINPFSNQKIVFEYESYQMDMEGGITALVEEMDGSTEFSVTRERMVGTYKRLRRIKFSNIETAEFNYSANPRVDIPMEKSLDNIDILYNGQSKLKWEFEMGYFVKNTILPVTHTYTAEDKAWSRLCLQKLTRKGTSGAAEPPYVFNYWLENTGSLTNVVPPIFSFYQDVWGFFNPRNLGFYNPVNQSWNTNNDPYTAVGDNLMPQTLYYVYTPQYATYGLQMRRPTFEARNGVLKSVRNPLGGTIGYEYELNYFYSQGQHLYGTGGVRVNKVSMTDGINTNAINIKEYKYLKEDGVTTSGWGGSDGQIFERNTNVRVYQKCGNSEYPGIVMANTVIAFHKALTFTNSIGFAIFKSFSFVVGFIVQGIIANFISDLLGPNSADFVSTSRNSNMFNAHNTIPFQYARVEVIDKLGVSDIGKTVFEFTTPAETNTTFAIDVPTLASPFSSRQRFAFWLYGLPKSTTVFDKLNNIIERNVNEYSPVKYTLTDARFLSQKWMANKRTYDCSETPNNLPGTQDIDHDKYHPICGRIELISEKKYVYNANNEFTESAIYYAYDPVNYTLKKTQTTNSRGNIVETYDYYAPDYALAGPLQTMKDNNMIGIPVSSQTRMIKDGITDYILSGKVSEFGIAANGDIKAIKSYETRSVDPFLTSAAPFSSTQLIPNTNFYKETGFVEYNADGLPVQAISETGKIATLFDYNKKLVVATVINAAIADVAYTSFEADATGGWTFPASKIIEDWSPTGKKYLKAKELDNGTSITRVVSNTKTYTLSFWAQGDVPFLNGGTFTLKRTYANIATGYTYYEYEVTNGTTISITNLTGGRFGIYRTFNIDEVRLYPAEARMTTVTFDPLVGKTSECDENGRIIYYEYDGLGRLRLARDGERNVIKTYEYNYKQ